MRDKPVGGKKKTAPKRDAERAAMAAFKKFADHLNATDVGGKGRSAAARRRQSGLKKEVDRAIGRSRGRLQPKTLPKTK